MFDVRDLRRLLKVLPSHLEAFKDRTGTTSHTLMVSSTDPDAIRRAFGENATAQTQVECPASVWVRDIQSCSRHLAELVGDLVQGFLLSMLRSGLKTIAEV